MEVGQESAVAADVELRLFKAIEENDLAACQSVIRGGVDWNGIIRSYDADGSVGAKYLPLHLAAYSGYPDLCEFFIQCGADPNSYHQSRTALHHAAIWGMVDVCRTLVKHGAQVSFKPESPPDDYLTPLQMAIEYCEVDYGLVDVIRLFVTEFGENPQQYTSDGRRITDLTSNGEVQRVLLSLQTELAVSGGLDTGCNVAMLSKKRSSGMSLL